MNFGERLKQARTQKGLSQQKVADLIGVTRGCYSNYEQGTREPSLEILKRICVTLEVSSDFLVGITEE